MNQTTEREEIEIDLFQIFRALWHRIWWIIAVTVIAALIGLLVAKVFVTPKYQASVRIYVNNSAQNNNGNISTTEISAAKSLVDTYVVILKSPSTLEEIRDASGLSYSEAQLSGMISASSVNSTQIFRVTVTSDSKVDSQRLANTVAAVLPGRIAEIVDGSSVRIVDYATMPTAPSSPNVPKYVALAALIGFALTCLVIIIRELTDDVIHDENYLMQSYSSVPVLGMIPDLVEDSQERYGYAKAAAKGKGAKA